MAFWLRLALLYVLLAVGIVALFGFDWRTGLELLFIALPFLQPIVSQSPQLYLRWSRLKYWVLNKETAWDLSLQFRGHFSGDALERFVHRLALEHPGETEVLQSESSHFLIRYRRLFTVDFTLAQSYESLAHKEADNEMDFAELDVTVYEQQVSYRRSRQVLERILIPFAEQLKDKFTPESTSYSLRVRFDRDNPFFGIYLKHLRADLVSEFQFEFHLPTARSGEYVRVGKDAMTVTAGSVETFRQAVEAGLTFSAAAS
jgi:hypothetical protein